MDDRTGQIGSATHSPEGIDPDARADELRSEIERTREEMSETVDAIQDKLRPGNLVASAASGAADRMKNLASTATGKVKDMASTTTENLKDMTASAADTTEEWWDAHGDSGLIGRIRNNPMPAVLAGIGLTWLAFGDGGAQSRRVRGRQQTSSADWQSSAERSSRIDRSHPMLHTDAPRRVAASARQTMNSGRYRLEAMIRDYPLPVAAAALVIGASLGMAVPETESENELMGEVRDSTLQRAQDAASGAVERVKGAVAEVATMATGD